jgi:hypothetical protein
MANPYLATKQPYFIQGLVISVVRTAVLCLSPYIAVAPARIIGAHSQIVPQRRVPIGEYLCMSFVVLRTATLYKCDGNVCLWFGLRYFQHVSSVHSHTSLPFVIASQKFLSLSLDD